MGCSGSGTSCLSKLDLKLGRKFAVKGRGSQGGLTTSCPDTTEGVVELVQLPKVGVEHLEVASRHIFLPESLRLPQTPSGEELDSCKTPDGADGDVGENGRQRSELAKVLMELSKCASTSWSGRQNSICFVKCRGVYDECPMDTVHYMKRVLSIEWQEVNDGCPLDRFTKTFFSNFQNSRSDLCYMLIYKQMLEKVFCSNIALSLSSGNHLFDKAEYMWRSCPYQVWAITFDWSALAT